MTPDEPKTLGEHLKRRRLQQHTLQKQVAAILGVCPETFRNWERDIGAPRPRQWPAVIKFLGYSPGAAPTSLGKRIAYERRQAGLTQEELAEKLKVDPVSIYRWERGFTPSHALLKKLQQLLDLPTGLR